MQMNILGERGGLVRKNVPVKLFLSEVNKRQNITTVTPPPPPTPQGLPGAAADDPNAPQTPGGGPKKGPPGNGTTTAAPQSGKGPKKAKGAPGNGTALAIPPTTGMMPPPPPNGLPPPPPSGTPPPPPSGIALPPPTGTPPPPASGIPQPPPTGTPPIPPSGTPPPRPNPNGPPATTLSTSIIPSAALETLPSKSVGPGINSNAGAIVDTTGNATAKSSMESKTTVAVSVVVIILGAIALLAGGVVLFRRIMRKRRLGLDKTKTYPAPPSPPPPMQTYATPEADAQRHPPPMTRSISYPNENYAQPTYTAESGADRAYFNNLRKTVGGDAGVGGYDGKVALSQNAAGVDVAESLQHIYSMENAYPRDVKVPPVELPRDI